MEGLHLCDTTSTNRIKSTIVSTNSLRPKTYSSTTTKCNQFSDDFDDVNSRRQISTIFTYPNIQRQISTIFAYPNSQRQNSTIFTYPNSNDFELFIRQPFSHLISIPIDRNNTINLIEEHKFDDNLLASKHCIPCWSSIVLSFVSSNTNNRRISDINTDINDHHPSKISWKQLAASQLHLPTFISCYRAYNVWE